MNRLDIVKIFYVFFHIRCSSVLIEACSSKNVRKGVRGSIVEWSVKVEILTFSIECCLSVYFAFVHTEMSSQGWASWRLRQPDVNGADVSPAESPKGLLLVVSSVNTFTPPITYYLKPNQYGCYFNCVLQICVSGAALPGFHIGNSTSQLAHVGVILISSL